MASSFDRHRRRHALTSEGLLKQLPKSARARHCKGAEAEPVTQERFRPGHIRRQAMSYTDFSRAMASALPPSYQATVKNAESNSPRSLQFSRNVHHSTVGSCDLDDNPPPNIHGFLTQIQLSSTVSNSNPSKELSSLEYSDSSDDSSFEGSVPECIESAIFKSVAVALDFSALNVGGLTQCVICLETLESMDVLATISGCAHHFCFDVSSIIGDLGVFHCQSHLLFGVHEVY